jgi:cupin 2 domain-containing protein
MTVMPIKKPRQGNLYAADAESGDGGAEFFHTLLENRALRLERILSRGHATPEGEWYDQNREEWVVLLSGAATLRIEGRSELLHLAPGDWVLLPARLRHRVEWTAPEVKTTWLALHYAE